MCGIAGIYFLGGNSTEFPLDNEKVLAGLRHRGPDGSGQKTYPKCHLFHSRLSILDLSDQSAQPFLDPTGNKCIVYNGEIFNYKELAKTLNDIKTTGDVEVLMKLFEKEKVECLSKLNGFFSFSYYDSVQDELFLVRDRYGVKPLYYYCDEKIMAFASELKPLLHLTGKQELNSNALYTYLRLNYITGRQTIFKNVYRVLPGEFLHIKQNNVQVKKWYSLTNQKPQADLYEIMVDSVKIRLNADVPVGSFLSGGLDSSIISAIAAKHHKQIHTFSIGYADEPYFDETHYAEQVSRHIGSQHNTFRLTNRDFLENISDFLSCIDEPFADSSAFNTYLLSKYTSKDVKVALSGDGADELFMGYGKHRAEYLRSKFIYKNIIPLSNPVLNVFTGSRNSKLSNKIRQLKRFADSAKLPAEARYINWACISGSKEVDQLMKVKSGRNYFLNIFNEGFEQNSFNAVNYCDLKIVLPDDMLVKADRMSMQHGLEIRNPFMDFRVVEFALNLPMKQKINSGGQKIILKETFKDLLPGEIINRAKKGFELPLWKWLNNELKSDIESKWLSKEKIENQGIFNYEMISELKTKLYSKNAGDAPAKIWALIVFQQWMENFGDSIKIT